MIKGPFIKDAINQGGGGLPKEDLTYLVKVMTMEEGGQYSQKIDDLFYERPKK